MSGHALPEDLRAEIERFLAAHHTVTLATVAADGRAHAASLLYALDGLSLVWTSEPGSRHSLHLEREHRVAATVAPDYADFRDIRGVQIHGAARRLLTPDECHGARSLLCHRYPFLVRLAEGPAALAEAWNRAAFYCLVPERITLIDNSRSFGYKAELHLER